jgi:hypothetical protein
LLPLALWHAVPQGLVDPAPRRAVWPGSVRVLHSEGGASRRRCGPSTTGGDIAPIPSRPVARVGPIPDSRPPTATASSRCKGQSARRTWERRRPHHRRCDVPGATRTHSVGGRTPHAAARRQLGRHACGCRPIPCPSAAGVGDGGDRRTRERCRCTRRRARRRRPGKKRSITLFTCAPNRLAPFCRWQVVAAPAAVRLVDLHPTADSSNNSNNNPTVGVKIASYYGHFDEEEGR